MATLSFDQNGNACGLPPFNAVSNRLFFFRINVFDLELPPQVDVPDPAHAPGAGGSVAQPGFARLGLPITDVFPHLMPEFGPQFPGLGGARFRVRLDRGVFLPAKSANRHYAAGHLVDSTAVNVTRKHVTVGGKEVPIPDAQWGLLGAGSPATLVIDGSLVRVLPPAEGLPTVPAAGRPIMALSRRSTAFPGAPFRSVRDLPDDQFAALCNAVYIDDGGPGYEWIERLSPKDRAKLGIACRHDARFAAFEKKLKGKNKLEPPHYEIGFVSEYEQVWDLTGYSRGGLLSSLTLAPEEELTLEVFTWDRSKLEQEESQTSETERSVESSSLARVSAQLNNELTDTTDKNASLGLGAPLPIGPITVDASGQASVSNSITQSVRSTVDTISESTRRASERFKTTSQVKVVQTRETGTETRVTRRIRNPNRGRTLTMHCFEVMEHYKISTRLLRADKFVLLAEIPQPRRFDITFVLAQEEKLRRALLDTNAAPGFAAAKKLLAQRFFDVRSHIKAEIEAAQAKARGDAGAPEVPPIVTLASQMRKALDRFVHVNLVDEMGTLANAYLPFNSISQKDRAAAEDTLGIFNFWVKFKTVTPGIDSRAQEFLGAIPTSGATSAKQAYEALGALTAGVDDEWLTTIKMIAASVISAQLAFTLLPAFPWLAPVLLEFAVIENNLGLPSLLERAKQAVRSYETTLQQPPAPTDPNNDKGQKMMTPPQLFSLQELSLADADLKKLVLHLEANRVYYLNSLFAQQDVNVRYETLKALGIQTFVENRLLGFLGSRAVFPLRVENLEPEARRYLEETLARDLTQSLQEIATVVSEVSLPTNGIHMEPVLGQCDALEPFLVDSRTIELDLRRAQADQAIAAAEAQGAEVARLRARLAANPPVLEFPFGSTAPDAGG